MTRPQAIRGLVLTALLVAFARAGAAAADEMQFEQIGTLFCERSESGSWWKPARWWVFFFSGAYLRCEFRGPGIEPETYRGRTGIEFGADFMPEALVFDVMVVQTGPQAKLAPHQLAGKFKNVEVLTEGRYVTLEKDEPERDPRVRLQAELDEVRGVAFGITYLKLERAE